MVNYIHSDPDGKTNNVRVNQSAQAAQHLSYCSNIHPGESWQQTRANLSDNLPGIRNAIAPDQDFGIGLRLSAEAATDLSAPEALAEFTQYLQSQPFYVFTLNGFPYGPFHGTTVKESVYLPDWLNPERLRYTNQLADLLAQLLPSDTSGSISTVPGAFKASIKHEGDVQIMAHNLVRHVAHLIDIKRQTGKQICLALEPEPCCFLETIEETCDFFKHYLYSHDANKLLCQLCGCDSSTAAKALHEHLTVCLDICHAAVEYEDAQNCITQLAQSECAVGKLQISAGLKFDTVNEGTIALLKPFEDNVYLHQVIARTQQSLHRYTDLHEAFASLDKGVQFDEWRVHFHVPVFLDRFGDYQSTQFFIKDMLALHKTNPISDHLEVETYTWGVLPASLKSENMQDAIIRELQWVLAHLR
jgi:hypothetical protein